MQIEAQARVNQDPSGTHLPATAWPRQMLAVMYATQRPLPESGRGDYDPPLAGNNGGEDEGRFLSLMKVSSQYNGWWCRLGCRARSFLPRVHLSMGKSGVRGRDPPNEEITKTVISRDEWHLRVGLTLSLFGQVRMPSAAAPEITTELSPGVLSDKYVFI